MGKNKKSNTLCIIIFSVIVLLAIIFIIFCQYTKHSIEEKQRESVLKAVSKDTGTTLDDLSEEAIKEIDNIKDGYSSTDSKKICKEQKYDISDSDFINFSIYDDGSIETIINISNTEKMSLALAYFSSTFSALDGYNSSICSICDDGIIIWTKNELGETITSTDKDGNSTTDLPDWSYDTLENQTMTDDEQNEFVEMLKGFSEDFTSQ